MNQQTAKFCKIKKGLFFIKNKKEAKILTKSIYFNIFKK